MNETDKLIEEQLKTLPPNLQQAIDAVPWKSLVQEIGKANVLDTEQITSLEQETMFIIYAFENPNDYVSNIIREVSVSEESAYTIAESVADKIFDPISQKSESGKATEEPIVITLETKEEALKELSRRSIKNQNPPVLVPELVPSNLPMIEEGEVAHTVDSTQYTVDSVQPARQDLAGSQIKSEPKVSLPDYRYEGGSDPYREPLG